MPSTQGESPAVLPHGSWPSPITTTMLTTRPPAKSEPGTDGDHILWVESRPQEQGRSVLIVLDGETPRELTPAPFNVRNRVHEYGGGVWTAREGVLVFSNFADNRLYRIDDLAGDPRPITPEGDFRYADLQLVPGQDRLIAVREDHRNPDAEAINTLVSLNLNGPNEDGGTVIVGGSDFFSSPRVSADGGKLAWLTWDHPNMPWDSTSLWAATLQPDGTVRDTVQVAGAEGEAAILPGWDRNGNLLYVSDPIGWWHLYRRDDAGEVTALTSGEREFGAPLWMFGISTWCELADGTLAVAWTEEGPWHLGAIAPGETGLRELDETYSSLGALTPHPDGASVLAIAGTPTEGPRLVQISPRWGSAATVGPNHPAGIEAGYVSVAQSRSWTAPDGATAHGLYYAPANKDALAPNGELPPLIVKSHGGPTSATTGTLNLDTQFWTSRGFAVLDVNYGGSTGYGRAYRERLNGTWGVVDVEDCESGALALANADLVDRERLIIKGGSAGGYTTLAALAFKDVFTAGASYYGIGDLEAMVEDTHKFESRYLDGLVGPYPEAIDTYRERSAIHHLDRLSAPMILLQGLDDKVVPPNQSQAMADALRSRGLPVAHLEFEGEGHGFRRAETQVRALEAELSFYSQVFGFTPADDIPTLSISNLTVAD